MTQGSLIGANCLGNAWEKPSNSRCIAKILRERRGSGIRSRRVEKKPSFEEKTRFRRDYSLKSEAKSYEVIAQKWRPQSFHQVTGQEHVIKTLQNQIRLNRIGHAYLFWGPRGTGKTTVARLFAKTVNCANRDSDAESNPDNAVEPCNECEFCLEITQGKSFDVIELDAASNRGIDPIRELRENTKLAPAACAFKIYIIDEAHMLTQEAFNALLKTLEEPPPHVIFILATTEHHKIPKTIVSRCQDFDFRYMEVESNHQ